MANMKINVSKLINPRISSSLTFQMVSIATTAIAPIIKAIGK
jgi:hypothetical protein